MARAKNIDIDFPLCVKAGKILKDKFEISTKALSGELKEFEQEISNTSVSASVTQSKAAKISVAINVYYSINAFKMDESIDELLFLFGRSIESDMAKIFALCSQELLCTIAGYPTRTFMDAQVHFIDESAYKSVIKIQSTLESSYENSNDKRVYNISRIGNLISPELCYKYSVKYTPKFKQINREVSVQKYQPGHYSIWKNTLIKDHNEYIAVHKPDEITITRLRFAMEAKLLAAKDEHEYMKEHKDDLEIRIIGYKNAELRPVINFTNAKHTNDKHLRSEVPNILWFNPSPFRSDMNVDEFINSSQNAYGDVYYKKKQ